jgi:hypothetical protein
MERWRTPGVREVLILFLLLGAVELVLFGQLPGVGPSKPDKVLAAWMLFWTWRVSRGGGISHAFLLLTTGGAYLNVILSVARHWNPLLAALAAVCAMQFLLLISPPVRARLGRETERTSWANVVAGLRRPPAWLLLGGVLAGLLVTLALLGNMTWAPVPGCTPAGSGSCIGLVEGYPLRWLTALQNQPMIDKGALFKDFLQWTLLSWSVLYVAWSSLYRQPGTSAEPSVSAATFA